MSEHEIKCGDVDGKGTQCVFFRDHFYTVCMCGVSMGGRPRGLASNDDPCHRPDARHAALVAQLGEAGVEGNPDV